MNDLRHPPTIEPTPEWIARRRAHLVRELEAAGAPARSRLRPRWQPMPRWRVIAVTAAAALLVTGAALAASGVNPLDWLRSGGPSEVRFSIDPSETVHWSAPSSLRCDAPSEGEFACSSHGSGLWVYDFLERVDAAPTLTRKSALAGLAASERSGLVSHDRAEEIRGEIGAVDDDFFLKLNVLLRLRSIGAAQVVRPGVLLVPPAGTPQIVTCRPLATGFGCKNLAAAVDVPVGAPIYALRKNNAWVEKPYSSSGPEDLVGLIEGVFGRPLTPAEERLLMTTSGVAGSTGSAQSQPSRSEG